MQPEQIKQLIEAYIPECHAIVTGDDGQHFTASVVSPVFSGKNRVQKQQIVYAPLNSQLNDGTIHAISIKTYTPDEWQQHQLMSAQHG